MSAAEIEALRLLMGLGWLDTYEVVRTTSTTRDSRGADVPTTTVAETGRCGLRAVGNQPQEAAIAGRIQSAEPAAVDLPTTTTLTAADDLRVNGQAFEVHGVHRGGNLSLFVTAVVSRS